MREKISRWSGLGSVLFLILSMAFLVGCQTKENGGVETTDNPSRDGSAIIDKYCSHRVTDCTYDKYPAVEEYSSVEDCVKAVNTKLEKYRNLYPGCADMHINAELDELSCLSKKKCDTIYNIEREVVDEDECENKALVDAVEKCENENSIGVGAVQ